MAPKPPEHKPSTELRYSRRGHTINPIEFTDKVGNTFKERLSGQLIPYGADQYILAMINLYKVIYISQPAPFIDPYSYIIIDRKAVEFFAEQR